jgi:hypothetical protein
MDKNNELVQKIMSSNASFILGNGAGIQANNVIKDLLHKALLDERIFTETWKIFFKEK